MKRFLILITVVLGLVFVSGELSLAETTESYGVVGVESVIPSIRTEDPDTMLDQYVANLFGMNNPTIRLRSSKPLTKGNKVIYDWLVSCIEDVAAGRTRNTVFNRKLTYTDLGLPKAKWTAEELGVPVISHNGVLADGVGEAALAFIGYDPSVVCNTLRVSLPYSLYWNDSIYPTIFYFGIYNENGVDYISFAECQVEYRFKVAVEFANGDFETKTGIANKAVQAAQNAQKIVNKYATLSDYDKLDSYREEICSLVSYNTDAWSDGQQHLPYGNPWQLVWVFDNDPTTNVVCEGYAKAFQYLCDQSEFRGDVESIIVYGRAGLNGNLEAHMWNVVHMPDGKNYVADITGVDSGFGYGVFLAGYSFNSNQYQYDYQVSGGTVTLIYHEEMFTLYNADQLKLSGSTFCIDNISIDETNFPDEIFRTYIAETFDLDGDDLLSKDEIAQAKVIEVDSKDITSMKGVEHFIALEELYCYDNQLNELDISGNLALTNLDCEKNLLTALDLSHNTMLSEIYCGSNPLEALDVSYNTALIKLNCTNALLDDLDVYNNRALENLDCSGNSLETLDVSNNTLLQTLISSDNPLTTLNVQANTALTTLICKSNGLNNLNVRNNKELQILICDDNNISELDISNNTVLRILQCVRNSLTNLNLEHNTSLETLVFVGNPIRILDISSCPQVETDSTTRTFLPYVPHVRLITAAQAQYAVLTLPDGLNHIESEAFAAIAMDAIEIPAGCATISANAFANCSNLKEVRIPEVCDVQIDLNAFNGIKPVIVTNNETIQQWANETNLNWVYEK